MAEPSESRKSSSTQDEKCRKHGIERSLFCKGDGCQRNICPVCLMKDHSYHDVIAPENGFVYCSDICTIEMLNVMMADMAISNRNGNQRPELGARSTEANLKKSCRLIMVKSYTTEKMGKKQIPNKPVLLLKWSRPKVGNKDFFHRKVIMVQSLNIVLF